MLVPSASKENLIAVVLGDTSMSAHHGCELVMENLRAGLGRVGITIICEHSGKQWQADRGVVNALKSADLLVINGEGTMHHDRPQGYDFVEAAETAALRGIPAYLVNCTWQQNSPELARRSLVFRRIFVRESRSAEELAAVHVSSIVVPDLTLATNWPEGVGRRFGTLVTDSTIPEVTKELLRLSRQVEHTDFVPVIASHCPKMNWKRRMRQRLQSVIGGLLDRGLGVLTSYASLPAALPGAREFLTRLSQSERMLTGRFHAVCFAILTGTPFLAMRSNSSKIESLLCDVGLSADRVVERGITPPELQRRLSLCKFSESEEQNRQRFLQSAKASIDSMFAMIGTDARTARSQDS